MSRRGVAPSGLGLEQGQLGFEVGHGLAAGHEVGGEGHDVAYWTEFLRALAEVDPDMAVNIEHEDAAYSQTEGLALAAKSLHGAAAAL
ncbi:hypothetical protein [Streptomyces purpurascens]|uniref:Xylose isomerase-like TIM barrel domain-containing protein n=1 Tax=Streptomyces purpurascens TaxID=1924 RepID=A0ABZ1MDL2_STREF|nr:hypothetical protein [Streptomyces purpurascens]MCE7050154.1 hypothetical protein [Streptomyces purpurascens]